MQDWYYSKKELKNSPSSQDGIDYKIEMRYRKEGAKLIINIGSEMNLGYNTVATGAVYYHRFYMCHSFKQFSSYVMACCCLLLAGKVEETPKKCRDIIKTARGFLKDEQFASFGKDPKEEVMKLERILLQTIKFDLQVEHPYQYLLKYAKCLKGDRIKLPKMVQMAWIFVNDSLCTTLALQWEPEIIAVALMHLAGKLSKFEVEDWIGRSTRHVHWWDMFVEDVTMNLLEDICHQVLDLYSETNETNPPESPPLQFLETGQQMFFNTPRISHEQEKSFSPDQSPSVTIKIPPSISDVPSRPYQIFTNAPLPGASSTAPFTNMMTAPPYIACLAPPISAPPPTIFPFVSNPPPCMSAVPPEVQPFFSTSVPPPNRLFYPPPT